MELVIGRYRILKSHGKMWIFINSGEDEGEGMEVSEDKLEKALGEFYDKNF